MSTEATMGTPTSMIIPADAGTVLHAFGDTVQVKLSGEQTQGSLVVALGTVPPGGGPPPHIHHNEDEMFLILEGQYQFLANGEWSDIVGSGTVVYTQRGALHTFRNAGDTPGRQWIITTPGGFDQFFGKCADVFAKPGPPDMGRILAISGEYGLEFVPPLTPPPAETV